jgi:hypothetical protein
VAVRDDLFDKDTDQAGRSDGEDLATSAARHSVFAQAARIHAPN